LEKRNRFQIFAAAELIWQPFALTARVVEIQHRSDSVDAQAVDVILVEPEEGVREQEILNFIAAVIKNQRTPVGMSAAARVGVLVKMRAIEKREPVRIAREMPGRPVEKNSDACLMAAVDERHEILRRTITAGDGEIADRLVSPRRIER